MVDPFARAKKITIHFEMETKDLQEAKFDARRMKQVFIAVLDNAVKFSIEGAEVRVRLTYQSGIFSVVVEDDGVGMPDAMLSHITEKFFRGNDMYTFDYEGMGLGLHIAQAIVALHQGNISFTSKPKKGTIVSIQFPSL
jgi:signal transduction histidine kinase